ncbi:MAG: hypothetical protein QXX30_03190 [Candidatus Aenigmatarchaeota archaeon]
MIYPRNISLSLTEEQITSSYSTFSISQEEKTLIEKIKTGKLYVIYPNNISLQNMSFYFNQTKIKDIYPEQTFSDTDTKLSSFDFSLSYLSFITHLKVSYQGFQGDETFKFILNVPEEFFNNPFVYADINKKTC